MKGTTRERILFCCLIAAGVSVAQLAQPVFAQRRSDAAPLMGIPMSGLLPSDETSEDIFPEGARVIDKFMSAWRHEDYAVMYSLIDEESLVGYDFEQARFEFQFMEFRQYRISSVRKVGEDYEFLLSYGDWRDGDKEMKKMVIDGSSHKIKLQRNRSFLGRSL